MSTNDFTDPHNLRLPPGSPARRKPRIATVPLINIVFILLCAGALYLATMDVVQKLDATLPVTNPDVCHHIDYDPPLILQASADRGVYVDRKVYDISEVSDLIKHYKEHTEKSGKNPRVLITGDDRANYRLFVQLIDKVKGAGIKSYALETNYRASGR